MDDIALVGKTSELKKLIEFLQTYFIVTIKGKLSLMLGIEIQYHTDAISFGQQLYIQQILQCFGMGQSHPVSTLIDMKSQLYKATDDEPSIDQNLYQ